MVQHSKGRTWTLGCARQHERLLPGKSLMSWQTPLLLLRLLNIHLHPPYAMHWRSIPRVDVDFGLCLPPDTTALPTPRREAFYYRPEEEIARGPAAWLWDYLRRR